MELYAILESDGYNSAEVVGIYKYREDAEKYCQWPRQWIQMVYDVNLKKVK